MTAQPQELGHVVGWTVVLYPDEPKPERVEVSTLAEWEVVYRRTGDRQSDGWPVGGEFYTRVQTATGIDEYSGANPRAVPVGTKMIKLPCKHCGKKRWFNYHPNERQDYCICEDCNGRYDD